MKLPRPLLAGLAALACLCTAHAERMKVLIIEGASNHDWNHRKDILTAIISRDGSFDVEVSVTPGAASDPAWSTWSPNFANYDVVLSGYSNGALGQPRWPAAVETAFQNYVNGGGGFVAFHEACDSFAGWTAYDEMLGLRWNPVGVGKAPLIGLGDALQLLLPGLGEGTSHGDRVNVEVKRLGNHPIHAGLPSSWMATDLEVWRYPRGPANNLTVLSYAKDPLTQLQFPVEWTTTYGAGRVYASSYGHVWEGQTAPEGMRCAAFQEILVRALKWCAGENPAATIPSDFPSPTQISLRANAEGISGFGGPKAVAPFANGALPTLSIVPTGVEVVKAFPALAWDAPIEAKPWPMQAGQLMVVEMDGRVYKIADSDTTTTKQEVLDIRDRVWHLNWENQDNNTKHGGILSAVFHPQFGKGQGKDHLYVYYTHNANDAPNADPPFYDRLARYTWNGTAFTPASEQLLIHQYDTAKGHEGGGMCFGADGFLYLAFGDEGTESGDSTPHTQKIDDRPRSGVWRMDVDMQGGAISHPIRRQPLGPGSFTQNYYIPSDNPWQDVNGGILEEFYAIGLREPHRMTFDAATGLFWIGDVGANNREEVSVIDEPGLNFEWNYKEGIAEAFRAAPSPLIGTSRGPVFDYSHAVGSCIIGGHVYRGTALPQLAGKYLFGDNGTQLLYALEYDPVTKQTVSVQQFAQGRAGYLFNGISSFGEDTQGEPLLLQLAGANPGTAQISRIKPAGPPGGGTWQYPQLLSQTGLFTNLATLTPAASLIPFDVNMPLWSAGMHKKRWVMIPNDGVANTPLEQISFSENGAWQLPVGSVFVKHFARPDNDAPLETRLLVHGTDGWGGVTYKWRPDGSEADLLEDGGEEVLTVDGQSFEYLYPSRQQCNLCHTGVAGPVLGFRTRQLNRNYSYPGGGTANQIESLSVAGFLPQVITEESLAGVLTSADANSPTVSDEAWARSYLDSNCSHCHQPGGSSRAFFDARLTTPLDSQSIICGPVIDGLGAPAPAVVKPGSFENSVMLLRMNTIDECCSMPPLAKGIVDTTGVSHLADWILGMDADSCTKTQGFYDGGEIGIPGPTPPDAHGPDLWHSNIVVNEDATYTNTTGTTITVSIDRFRFNAGRTGDPLTPFVVKVNGDNNFSVVAIGTPRTQYAIGSNDLPFSDGVSNVTLAPGQTIAIGFMDANPDGSGGSVAGIIDWDFDGDEIWYGGGETDADGGSVSLGQMPDHGTELYTTLFRRYQFAISYIITGYEVGNGPAAAPGAAADGANSNLVINETDTFTNTTAATMTVTVGDFRFHAARTGDPVTPFLVKVNSDNDFTVLAVGSTRTSYVLGANSFPFAPGARVTLAPGEKLAAGFTDSFPDGTGGTGPGVISYTDGGDQIYYSYDVTNVGSILAAGQAPVPKGYQHTNLARSYYFSISLGFGGKEDEDADGLPDSWELAYAPNLGALNGSADSDGDGMSNAEEHAAGTDPTNPASLLMGLGVTRHANSVTASVKTVPGRYYKLEGSVDLQSWTSLGTWKAASWPATSTSMSIPIGGLPGGGGQKLFVRFSPAE
ncbi:ThuA domain-containing protein [Luteolibacter sp. GHJ8]|uniref:ThuA domain-containing protein n=1 Tax=Luteolibacter rhizosphaerae TaxID=2989719 RepID=A0ABT3G109_9BACT|nr:ThuA domain-containing protein [Luteolibacter rhizosphaerae]MCW1913513.1 ThuA domain-containing protein [Luteolibacter rhizosphaerae]